MTRRFIKRENRLDPSARQPWPAGHTWTVHAVALLVGKTRRTIYNTLYVHADRFSPRKYAQLKRRGGGDRRFYRILTAADVRVIRQCFTVRVK